MVYDFDMSLDRLRDGFGRILMFLYFEYGYFNGLDAFEEKKRGGRVLYTGSPARYKMRLSL